MTANDKPHPPLAGRLRTYDFGDGEITLRDYGDDPDRYIVTKGEAVLGEVERKHVTRERKTPGNRYVNRRWTSKRPVWGYRLYHPGISPWFEAPSLKDAVSMLARQIRPW